MRGPGLLPFCVPPAWPASPRGWDATFAPLSLLHAQSPGKPCTKPRTSSIRRALSCISVFFEPPRWWRSSWNILVQFHLCIRTAEKGAQLGRQRVSAGSRGARPAWGLRVVLAGAVRSVGLQGHFPGAVGCQFKCASLGIITCVLPSPKNTSLLFSGAHLAFVQGLPAPSELSLGTQDPISVG